MNKLPKSITIAIGLFMMSASIARASPKLVQTVDQNSFDYQVQGEIRHQFTTNSDGIGAIAFYTTDTIDAFNPIFFEFSLFDENNQLLHQETRIQEVRIRAYEYFWFGFPVLNDSEEKHFTVQLATSGTDLNSITSLSLFSDEPITRQFQRDSIAIFLDKFQQQQLFWVTYLLFMLFMQGLVIVKLAKKMSLI